LVLRHRTHGSAVVPCAVSRSASRCRARVKRM
jgi:hypothetical protein